MLEPKRPNFHDAVIDLFMEVARETGIIWLTEKLNDLLLRLGRWWKTRGV